MFFIFICFVCIDGFRYASKNRIDFKLYIELIGYEVLIAIFILASYFLIAFNATAQEDVSQTDHRQQILNLINNYGEKIDDCFFILPADFLDVSIEYS